MSFGKKSQVKISEEYNIEEQVRVPITDLDIHNSIDPGWQENFLNSDITQSIQQESESSVDDDLYFFKSIIPDLKQLPREKNVSLRLEILKLVHDKCCKRKDYE